MANSTQAKNGGSKAKGQECEQGANLLQTLLHFPPRAWSLLRYRRSRDPHEPHRRHRSNAIAEDHKVMTRAL